jgi:hypothetical protein
MEDRREFVHQRDVEVALGILDDLGGLGGLDARRLVDAGLDDRTIDRGDDVERAGILSGDDLVDDLKAMRAVAWIDPLRRIAEVRDAPRSARRSGRFASSIGVGTVTMKKSAARRSIGSALNRKFPLRRSSGSTSRVRSWPARSSVMRSREMSNAMTPCPARANAAATGSPT